MNLLKTTVLAAAFVGLGTPAAAQNLPGYVDDYDAAEAQFRAWALEGFQRTLSGWTEAVLAGDVDAALHYYADETSVYIGEPGRGKEGVRSLLLSWIESVDGFRTGLSDFAASGSMSYASVNVVINAVNPAEDGDGTMIFVLKRRGRDWLIRSHTLVRD